MILCFYFFFFSKIIPSFFTIKEGVFSTSPSLLQGELHLSHQASLPSGTRGCNRPPVLRTAALYGWRGIKALRQIVRAGTAWGWAGALRLFVGWRIA